MRRRGEEEARRRGDDEARTRGGEEEAKTRESEASSPHRLIASSPLHLLLTWLLALPAITPLFQPTLTRSADGLLHLYRLVALDHLIRQGVFFTRWWPDLAYGYGLPLFVFYAPLSYYLTEIFHLLGLGAVASLNVSAALALLISAAGVYMLVKDWFGPLAGMLAGAAYVYAPYQLFNTFSRGSLPVIWAGALFPFAFWAFGRLMRTGQPIYLPLSALTLGAALLAHNISSLLFLPLLILYLAIELFFTQRQPHISHLTSHVSRLTSHASLRVAAALSLGLALAAFFWLPANLERGFAQTQRVITPPDFDYHANFVNLSQLFSLPEPANTGLLNPSDPLTLGLAQIALAALGLIIWGLPAKQPQPDVSRVTCHVSRITSPPILFAALSLAATLFMMLPIAVGVWDGLPLMAFVQQPHRLLSVTAFLLAILAGAGVAALPDRLGLGLTVIGIILIFFTAVPLLYPRYYEVPPADPTLTGMLAYEHASGAIGTTSFGEYLPIWVQQVPRESPLEPLYQAGATIERLDRAYLPAGASVESAVYGVNQMELTLDAPQPFQAVFHTFYFPGWQASVDGQPAPIAPVTERGLIGVTVPTGRHHLSLRFAETPVRQFANVISIIALLVIIILSVSTLKVREAGLKFNLQPSTRFANLQPSTFMTLMVLALTLILVKTLYLDRYDNPLKHVFNGTQVARSDVSHQVNFGHQINLLGYDLSSTTITSGQTLDLTLYWQARQLLITNYSALTQLVDEQQHLYSGQDNLHPGNLPTTRWKLWGFVRDVHAVQVPPGTPPGDYFLVVGLYDPVTWARLPVVEGSDPGWSDVIAIPVTVTLPTQPSTMAELGITWPMPEQTFEVSAERTSKVLVISLLGATPERETIQRNDFLRIALFWEASEAPAVDYQVSLRLLASDSTVALAETAQPSFGRYPTSRWSTGERLRDNHAFWIPPGFPAGTYRLQVQLLDEAGQPVSDWFELGKLTAE